MSSSIAKYIRNDLFMWGLLIGNSLCLQSFTEFPIHVHKHCNILRRW